MKAIPRLDAFTVAAALLGVWGIVAFFTTAMTGNDLLLLSWVAAVCLVSLALAGIAVLHCLKD